MFKLLYTLATLPILVQCLPQDPSEVYAGEKADRKYLIESRIKTAEFTAIVNLPESGLPPNLPGLVGPDLLQDSWTESELHQTPENQEFNQKNVTMYTYKKDSVITIKNINGNDVKTRPHEDRLFELNCIHEVAKNSPNGTMYHQTIYFDNEAFSVQPYGNDTMETLKVGAHFYCPEAKCIHAQCEGQTPPTWDTSVYN